MTGIHTSVLPKKLYSDGRHERSEIQVAQIVIDSSRMEVDQLFKNFETSIEGLTEVEAQRRLATDGPNVLAKDQRTGIGQLVLHSVMNPLVILLAVLACVSFATGDFRAGTVMTLMIVLGVGLKLIQEAKADNAAAKLKAMITVTATVEREGVAKEIAISHLVRGDVVTLAAGDMIPADVRVLAAKDLFVIQSSLTGESFPVEKFAVEKNASTTVPVELTSIAYLGTSVESGTATALVLQTGTGTYLGSMAQSLSDAEPPTAFDRGISSFTWLLIPEKSKEAAKGKILADFLNWMVDDGQKMTAELTYAPLPGSVAEKVKGAIKLVQ